MLLWCSHAMAIVVRCMQPYPSAKHSYQMEYDIHTVLDLLTLAATAWVLYLLWVPLKESYERYRDQDIVKVWYVVRTEVFSTLTIHGVAPTKISRLTPCQQVVPCLVLAIVSHPKTRHLFVFRVLWAFCVYLEAVSVVPQLVMMQRANVVEKFTAHYVFALGLSRFVSCAHWVLQVLDGDTFVFKAMYMGLWPACVLLSEIVQTFVLADFWCVRVVAWTLLSIAIHHHQHSYYYVKSYAEGTGVIHLPAGIV